MGMFSKPKTNYVSSDTNSADDEKNLAAKKQRLLETQGGFNGSSLASKQGKSVRRIFGT